MVLKKRQPRSPSKLSSAPPPFASALTARELRVFRGFKSPRHIQDFLDGIAYSTDPVYRSPRSVLRDRKAHCFDGALFAAASLRFLGYPPLIIDLLAENDDDHLLAVFRDDGLWGAVAKSNFTGLRFREPIHRTLRELVLTYFEQFFNTRGAKSLRRFTRPLNLAKLDALRWMTSDEQLEIIVEQVDAGRQTAIVPSHLLPRLARVDRRSFEAGMAGADPAGLFTPK